MLKKALVPLDGTDLAEGILAYVKQLASGLNMSMTLLTVIDSDALDASEKKSSDGPSDRAHYHIDTDSLQGAESESGVHDLEGGDLPRLIESAESQIKHSLGKQVAELASEGVEVEAIIAFGQPADAIMRVARDENCDLIAMSTHGRNVVERGLLGSVTNKVVHSSHLPVLTVTPETARKYWSKDAKIARVMVPLDGSELAETVLPYVEQIAGALSLEVVLVRVPRSVAARSPYSAALLQAASRDVDQEVAQDAERYLKQVAETLATKGLDVTWKLARGPAGHSLIELARKEPNDLIIMSTHGRSGFRNLVLGSVAEAVIRASGDPVLVIPPDRRDS
ncbi:MAG: universal stress protein [SAR202 cluster bacterium]|nr:universal stress protein [SAR202 cluster bacterium]MDP6715810.1 universal stress protein [SAR202 cluster bacterium]